jgi:hypothetical protein
MEPRTERRDMTINGKKLSIVLFFLPNQIDWNVFSDTPITVEDIRTVQRSFGYDPCEYIMGKMCFKDDGSNCFCSWVCTTEPTD